ncbi:MAG: TrkH family potassium uptake protein [Rhodospirillales bacterium]|nr:TrkH family potassium uptake protein [Rhodospirillales bacterium]
MVDLRPVFFIIGVLLLVLATAMLLPMAADMAEGNPDWQGFAWAAAATLFVGGALILTNRIEGVKLNLRQAFLLTTLSWVVLVAFGALPFSFSSLRLGYADAYFETMSGLTTTGSTVIAGLFRAPPGILLWRGLLQWMGGIGIIAMAIVILPMLRIGGMQLFRLESSDKSEKVLPRAAQIAAGIGVVYLVMTAVCALLYWIGGMTGFEAAIHAMATLSTGGFSTSDDSFLHFNSGFIDVTAIVFMLFGGMTFTLFLRVLQGDWRSALTDGQTRWYLGVAAAFTVAIALWQIVVNRAEPLFALRHSAFNVVSIITTTGFVSADYSQWGPLPVTLIFFLFFVGGCSGSTAGGIKIFRFQMLVQVARTHVRHTLMPSGVFIPKFNRKQITEGVTQSVLAFVFLYILIFAAIAAGLALTGLDLVTSLSGSAVALGNVGPGFGDIIGPVGNFSTLPEAAKWLLSLAMLLGRLELLTVLVLLSRSFWRS